MNPISSDGVFENFRITACYNSKNLLDGPDDNIFDEFSVLDGSIVSRSEIVEKVCVPIFYFFIFNLSMI